MARGGVPPPPVRLTQGMADASWLEWVEELSCTAVDTGDWSGLGAYLHAVQGAGGEGGRGTARSLLDVGHGESETLLSTAAHTGAVAEATLLLSAGASVHVVNSIGCTPLHHAAASGYAGMVTLLLAAGARPNACDRDGHTPLHAAAGGAFDPAVVATLLAAGGSPDVAAASRHHAGDSAVTPLACLHAHTRWVHGTQSDLAVAREVERVLVEGCAWGRRRAAVVAL
jgi:hypothetical protein